MVLSELIGPDILIVIGLVVLLFGGTQLPKLARSLGSAKGEFEKGIRAGADESESKKSIEADSDKSA
jgi:sec-independent protein translocase protein TatA